MEKQPYCTVSPEMAPVGQTHLAYLQRSVVVSVVAVVATAAAAAIVSASGKWIAFYTSPSLSPRPKA
jgi:hypothetical protein